MGSLHGRMIKVGTLPEEALAQALKDKIQSNTPVSSNELSSLVNVQRKGNTISNIIDQCTGRTITFNKVTVNDLSVTISDSDVDGVMFVKQGNEYFRRNLPNNTITATEYGAIGDGIADDTNAVRKLLTFANSGKVNVHFNYGIYAVREIYIGYTRIKKITCDNSNLGEASNNSRKTTIVPYVDNQRYILKFGGKEDMSAYTDVETYSCKGLKIQMNFSTGSKTVTGAALILECFTSSDIELGFYDIKGPPVYIRDYFEGNSKFYFRRINNFGGACLNFKQALSGIGSNTSELLIEKITVGQTDCTILKADTGSVFGGKCTINSVQFEHNPQYFDSSIPNPTKTQLDAATSIPLFNLAYADGLIVRNINLSGLNKNMMVKNGVNYKYSIYDLSGRFNIETNISTNDCNATTYLCEGVGDASSVLNATISPSIYNRSTAQSVATTDPIQVINNLQNGFVTVNSYSKKPFEIKYYNAMELWKVFDQQFISGKSLFSHKLVAGESILYKSIYTGERFMTGKSVKGLKAIIEFYTGADGINVQKIGSGTQTQKYTVTPNTWNTVVVDLYSATNNSTTFALRSIGDSVELEIKYIHFFVADFSDSVIKSATSAQAISSPIQAVNFIIPNPSNPSAQMVIDWLADVPRIRVMGTGAGANTNFQVQGTGNNVWLSSTPKGLGIKGVIDPRAVLELLTGSQTVPPLIIQPGGDLLTTPIEGSFETKDGNVYYTNPDGRQRLVYAKELASSVINNNSVVPDKPALNALYGLLASNTIITYTSITGGAREYRKLTSSSTSDWVETVWSTGISSMVTDVLP